jgi:lipid-binding SYLF domain-containing protein
LEGHNVKFPGGRDTDFVLLVMDSSSARSLLSSRVKLGSDVSVAAGYNADARNPAPPEAAIESAMNSQILSYSRNGGAFTGISLAGSTLRSDTNADQKLYGKRLTAKEILVDHKVSVASSARQLVNLLNVRAPSSQPQ